MSRRPDTNAIQARLDAATPGPWACDYSELGGCVVWSDGRAGESVAHTYYDAGSHTPGQGRVNATLIAAARSDLEELLAYIRHLEAALHGAMHDGAPSDESRAAVASRALAIWPSDWEPSR